MTSERDEVMAMYAVTNPATGEVIERFTTITDEQAREAIARAHRCFGSWGRRAVPERAAVLARAAGLFRERADDLASIITLEVGKRIAESRGEVMLAADIFEYYADQGERLLADEPLTIEGGHAVIQRRPIGVLIGVMPWNYPYYQVARFAAPNLVLGNTMLLKHAPNCPRSSAAIETLLQDAGLPPDAYINVYATHEQIAWMLANPRVQGVSLTGSERAGTAVAAEAGRNLKKVVLELGGADPMVVLDTDDLDGLVDLAAESRMENTGQACNAPKRMIVMSGLYDAFVEKLTERLARYQPGDPADLGTTLAPLSSESAAERVVAQVRAAAQDGARVRLGGTRLDRAGAYVAPTVLTDVTAEMDVYSQEIFGPVAVVFRAETEDDAVRLANDTPFGLGSSVFSADADRARRVGDRLEAGMVYINAPGDSQADLPFGGIKRSGVGRELGPLGVDEFVNKKIVRY